MSKYYFLFQAFILFIYLQPARAQVISDSVLLERTFQDNNQAAVDSMFNSWYSRSVHKHHGKLENDTIRFVYQVYTRFMKDYIHKKMAGKKSVPVNGNYFFIQDKIHFLYIDSLSFEDLHYYFNGIFQHYGLLRYRDSISTYIRKTIAKSYKDGSLKTIDPFYPDLKNIFYDEEHDPKPVYIKENNRLRTLIHFLGYDELKTHVTSYKMTNIVKLEKRQAFLNNVLEFNPDYHQFILNFKYSFTPKVLNILADANMRYAMVEYSIRGGVYMAFYPLKLIHSDNGVPLSWVLFVY